MRLRLVSLLLISGMAGLVLACRQARPQTIKDLDENMLDLRIYQENLGDELKAGRLSDASWLLEGMDSILHEVGRKFTTHRKLQEPFSRHYDKRMKEPVNMIRKGILRSDSAVALNGYRLLIKNCNGCHIDHDIDKTVWY